MRNNGDCPHFAGNGGGGGGGGGISGTGQTWGQWEGWVGVGNNNGCSGTGCSPNSCASGTGYTCFAGECGCLPGMPNNIPAPLFTLENIPFEQNFCLTFFTVQMCKPEKSDKYEISLTTCLIGAGVDNCGAFESVKNLWSPSVSIGPGKYTSASFSANGDICGSVGAGVCIPGINVTVPLAEGSFGGEWNSLLPGSQ